MTTLDQKLEKSFENLKISEDQRGSLRLYLGLLYKKDIPTWEHSVRVGLKGVEVADYTHIVDPKAMFYSGLLHDIGKCLTDDNSLKKTEDFDRRDMAELKKHPLDGYRLLKGIHDFAAEILVRHHAFAKDGGYPKRIPAPAIDFCKGTEANIMYYARILSLIDFYDAMMNRENDKFGKMPRVPTREEGKEIILKVNSDQNYLLNQLYNAEIF
jgi:HD-GYP domain-containing protein (c-di-GMP phosphodiesterase class II)